MPKVKDSLIVYSLVLCDIYCSMCFPCGSANKEFTCNVGDLGSIPGLGRSSGEGKDYPLQYSGLENSMDLYSPWGHKESDTTERLSLTGLHYLDEVNSTIYIHPHTRIGE